MFKEFKDFAMKGNVVDMAVGIIIGGAFGKIVSSLVNDVIMPPIGKLMAKQPEDRFALARELADLLGTWLAHLQQPDVIPPPERVAKLAVSGGDGPKRSGILKCLAGAAFAFTMLFAGILIVLDRNKGTLMIECDVDDVSVRITRGEEVVKRLTVTRSGESVRIAADRYVVELAGEHDGLTVEGGHVTLTRGGSPVVKIRKSIDYQVGAEQIPRTVDSARVVAFSELQQKGQRHVQLDRVSVEGDFDMAGCSPGEFFGGKAEVVVEHDHQTRTSLEGKVTFVNPLANADGNFCVQVAVENRQVNGRWLLVPGDAPKLTIHARVRRGQKGLTENQVKVPRTVDSIEPLGAVVPTSRRQDPAPRNSVRAVRQMYAKLPCDILGFAEPSKRFVVAQKTGLGVELLLEDANGKELAIHLLGKLGKQGDSLLLATGQLPSRGPEEAAVYGLLLRVSAQPPEKTTRTQLELLEAVLMVLDERFAGAMPIPSKGAEK